MISKTFQYILLGLSGIAVLNIGLALQWIDSPSPKLSTQVLSDNWQALELPKPVNYQAFIDIVHQKQAWREPPPSTTPPTAGASPAPVKPATPPKPEIVRDWQVRGIVKEGKQRFALLIDKEQKIKRYTQADVLPDGSVIEQIDDSRVEIVQNGTPEIICLYLQNPPQPTKPKK
jgi:hypothetical protein